jgi:KUP system potassium uptake protein
LTYVNLKDYLGLLDNLSNDTSIPKYATHLIYLTKSTGHHQIEKRIIDSIFNNNAKRADFYWFINIERADDPFSLEYEVEEILKAKVTRVNFRLGFRIQPRIGVMLKKVVEEMINSKEISISSRYPSVIQAGLGDFKFVILERFLSYDNEFSAREGFILNSYFSILRLARSDSAAYGIDSDQSVIEKVPLVVAPLTNINMKRAIIKGDEKEN